MTERWVKQVEKIAIWDSKRLNAPNVYAKDAVTLLARQHRAFVRMVKRISCVDGMPACKKCSGISRYKLLAALEKQGGK